MKASSTALLALLVCTSVGTPAQERFPMTMFSFEDTSCGAWTASAQRQPIRQTYLFWFRGFVSGYNHASADPRARIGSIPDNQTLALYVDKFCRDNPLDPFVAAAFRLVQELPRETN